MIQIKPSTPAAGVKVQKKAADSQDSTYYILTDVANGLQCWLFHVLCTVLISNIGHQLRNKFRPLIHGDLCTGDASNALWGRAGPVGFCTQGLQNL